VQLHCRRSRVGGGRAASNRRCAAPRRRCTRVHSSLDSPTKMAGLEHAGMTWSKCSDDRPLETLETEAGIPRSCLLPDGSELAVESVQVEHLLRRADERLGLDVGEAPYTVAEVLEQIAAWSLLFVVKRALLQRDDNFTYVFDPGEGDQTHLMAVGVESKRLPPGSRELAHEHTPADRVNGRVAKNEPPCISCGGTHHRVIKTVHPLSNTWKKKFVLGLANDRRVFDPATDAEWFSSLPRGWSVSADGSAIRLQRHAGAQPVAWEDAPVAMSIADVGDVPVYRLGMPVGRRLADSYSDAVRDGRLRSV
jgi:hypothetical protein